MHVSSISARFLNVRFLPLRMSRLFLGSVMDSSTKKQTLLPERGCSHVGTQLLSIINRVALSTPVSSSNSLLMRSTHSTSGRRGLGHFLQLARAQSSHEWLCGGAHQRCQPKRERERERK